MKRKTLKNWLQLGLGLFFIWLAVTQFHHLLTGKAVRELFNQNRKKDTEAGALFYTESEEALKVEYRMKKRPHTIDD